MISDEKLDALNRQGWIPGPQEGEQEFLKRVEKFAPQEKAPEWALTYVYTQPLFGFAADWIPLRYERKGLAPWQGAVTWVNGQDVLVQLHPTFRKRRYLGMYEQSEVLAHEAVHAVRMAFPESAFEEYFAYMTSKSRLRRWLGPLLQKSSDALLFFLAVAIALSVQVLDMFVELPSWVQWAYLLPPALLIWGILRSCRLRGQLAHCRKRLASLLADPKKSMALLLRLTDEEIQTFSQMSPEQIRERIQEERDKSLRGRLLNLFFSGTPVRS